MQLERFAIAGALIAFSVIAHAETKTNGLIVRFKDPSVISQSSTRLLQVAQDLKVIDQEKGIVRLQFANPEDAEKVATQLQASQRIASVAPNYLYRPAMNFRLNDARVVKEASPFLDFTRLFSLPTNSLPDVSLAPTQVVAGTDPLAAKDWAIKAIGLDKAGDVQGSADIVTAVIDTGIDYNHEDLSGGLWRKIGNEREVGYDFAHNNAQPYDVLHFDVDGCLQDYSCRLGLDSSKFLVNPGHGTHCAGHVAAVMNNSVGIRGIGAGSRVMGIKFFYDYGEPNAGQGDDAAALKAIDYAIANGVKVISASWGGRIPRAEAEASELKAAMVRAQQAGILFVVAAGNDAVDQDSIADPSYPAAYDLDNILVVAASDASDGLAEFSSYGAKSVHIAAPGVKILSTTADGKYNDVVATYHDSQGNEREMDWDGTSMATPVVAGAAALVWSKYPNADYHEIKDRLLKSARKVSALSGKISTGGVLDVSAALR